MDFLERINQKARESIKTIVLPEGTEPRIIKAAKHIADNKIANVVLLGNKEEIEKVVPGLNLSGINIIDFEDSELIDKYCEQLYELRKEKGMTLEKAKETIKDANYFGVMMVYNGQADGMVSGAIHSTADTLRPALQIVKTAPNTSLVSSFFLMSLKDKEFGSNGIMLFTDCGLNENPDANELSQIAITSATTFNNLVGETPKIAMLSYSTYGSAKSDMTKKVIDATNIIREKAPEIIVDGELQVDAAIVPEIAKSKAKGSPINGSANVLVFPDLNAGNIGYKLVQRFAKADAFGPITQGLRKPINDLSRGSTVEDIIGVIAITAVQAQIK